MQLVHLRTAIFAFCGTISFHDVNGVTLEFITQYFHSYITSSSLATGAGFR